MRLVCAASGVVVPADIGLNDFAVCAVNFALDFCSVGKFGGCVSEFAGRVFDGEAEAVKILLREGFDGAAAVPAVGREKVFPKGIVVTEYLAVERFVLLPGAVIHNGNILPVRAELRVFGEYAPGYLFLQREGRFSHTEIGEMTLKEFNFWTDRTEKYLKAVENAGKK